MFKGFKVVLQGLSVCTLHFIVLCNIIISPVIYSSVVLCHLFPMVKMFLHLKYPTKFYSHYVALSCTMCDSTVCTKYLEVTLAAELMSRLNF